MHSDEETRRELDKITETLRLCRLELAALQERQEGLLEDRNRARRRRDLAHRRSVALSLALAEHLAEEPPAVSRALLRRPGRRTDADGLTEAEQRDVALIESSPLFRPAWYLRQNLDVVKAGIRPALHYLRVGAEEERDPGPGFSTKEYLDKNPSVRESGVNPLVDRHLRRSAPAS